MEKKVYKQCQSCGMPLKKDEQGGGLEKDGSRSTMYCSHCYDNGEFRTPDMTLAEMQQLCDDILKKEIKASRVLRWMSKKQMPKLELWKK